MENREQIVPMRGLGLGPATEAVLGAASKAGYAAAASGPGTFRLARTSRPVWAKVGAIAGFPILGLGLLFLLVKRTESGSASVYEDRDGVKVRLVGTLDTKIVEALTAAGSVAVPGGAGAVPAAVGGPSSWSTAGSTPLPPVPVPAGDGEMVTGVPGGVPGSALTSVPLAPSTYQPAQAPVDETVLRSPLPPPPNGSTGPDAEIDVDRTIAKSSLAAPRHAPQTIRLVARDGSIITVGRGVVLGRQPERDPAAPEAAPTPIAEPSLSKTHATIAPTPAGVWVVDHHSTNGTTVSRGGNVASAPPGSRVEAPAGSVVVLGEFELRVDVA